MRFVLVLIIVLVITNAPAVMAQEAQVPDRLLEEVPPPPVETETMPNLDDEMLRPEDPVRSPGSAQRKTPFERYSDIPDEILAEAFEFYEYCDSNRMLYSHYDCECWSTKFLEERIRGGPYLDKSAIMSAINTQCISSSNAAGFGYQRCLKFGGLNYDGGMPPDEYCQCVGKNYGILLERANNISLSSRTMNRFMRSAKLRCSTLPPGVPNPVRRLDQ